MSSRIDYRINFTVVRLCVITIYRRNGFNFYLITVFKTVYRSFVSFLLVTVVYCINKLFSAVDVNVGDLEIFENGTVVNEQSLVEAGLLKKTLDGVKVLGNGELTKQLTVEVAAFSESAKQKIEEVGGKAEVK